MPRYEIATLKNFEDDFLAGFNRATDWASPNEHSRLQGNHVAGELLGEAPEDTTKRNYVIRANCFTVNFFFFFPPFILK